MLEIVNGKAQKNLLEKTELFEKENIIDMSLLLNIGNIKNIEEIEIRNECNEKILTKEKIDNFKNRIKENENIRIWYSSIDSEDYCFFLYIIYLAQKQNIKIKTIDVGIDNKWSITNYDKNEIQEIIKFEEELTEKEINNICKIWNQLEKENSDLRIIESKKIKSVNYEYLDKKILSELKTHNEIMETKLLINIRNKRIGNIHGFIIYDYRIKELIKQNKIKIIREETKMNILEKEEKVNILRINENYVN